jgi:bifunctional non-homologous end joining protein LigD
MLATLWPEPFSDDGWLFEEKVDGFRTLLYWDGSTVALRSRRGRDVTALYPELTTFSAPRRCVLDGEAVVRAADGIPRFELMQHRTGVASAALDSHPVEFIAFDALYDGEDVTGAPIEERRSRLRAIAGPFTVSDAVIGGGDEVWRRVEELGLEGMVAKQLGSPYLPGRRSATWRKTPRVVAVRAVVGGFTPGEGGRSTTFGSLQVGLWRGGALQWVGSVGTGFTDSVLVAIRKALDEQTRRESPFHPHPDLPKGTRWVEPQLVAMIGIKDWTRQDRMRAPRFLGFTDDDPTDITWESERL